MGILFGLRADAVESEVTVNFAPPDGSLILTQSPTADPISDAVNNVRFSCIGFASGLRHTVFEMVTRHFFRFELPERGRITVHAHLTNFGLATLSARGPGWLFDAPGNAQFFLGAKLRVRVFRANHDILFTRSTREDSVFHHRVFGDDGSRTDTAVVSTGLMERSITTSPPDLVNVHQAIQVRVQYRVLALAQDGADFTLDFSTDGGLNVPMVVVNY